MAHGIKKILIDKNDDLECNNNQHNTNNTNKMALNSLLLDNCCVSSSNQTLMNQKNSSTTTNALVATHQLLPPTQSTTTLMNNSNKLSLNCGGASMSTIASSATKKAQIKKSSIWYTNAQSLYSNLNLIRCFMLENEPKIMLLSETRTISDMDDQELSIQGYKLFRCDALNRHTGGVAIYLQESIDAYIVNEYKENHIWALCIKIIKGYINDSFCVIYRGHQSNIIQFSEFLDNFLEEIIDKADHLHVVGDFNIDLLKDKNAKKVIKITKQYNLTQLKKKFVIGVDIRKID
ncbi:CLUMA_CG011361, isoform A [Clunio marinus]|uniref:CLUMA_CG011361, isoform A n=1 Tax=Clunio marinus TaxID=568069 RepID=A0A1J1ICN1_9DIPT|nr:CLUMA_CG011361, isoform A [Clunio marinus]